MTTRIGYLKMGKWPTLYLGQTEPDKQILTNATEREASSSTAAAGRLNLTIHSKRGCACLRPMPYPALEPLSSARTRTESFMTDFQHLGVDYVLEPVEFYVFNLACHYPTCTHCCYPSLERWWAAMRKPATMVRDMLKHRTCYVLDMSLITVLNIKDISGIMTSI